MGKIQSNYFSSWILIHIQGGFCVQDQPYVHPLTSFLAMMNHAFELDIYTPTFACICNRILILGFLLNFSLWYALMMGINKPTTLLYLSTLRYIQALSNIWRWIVSLWLQLQLISFDVCIPISSLLKGVFLITPLEMDNSIPVY